MKMKPISIMGTIGWIIVVYNIWVWGFTPKGELHRKVRSVEKEIYTYYENMGEWPANLDFIENKDLLVCDGNPIEFDAEKTSFMFPVTYETPVEKLSKGKTTAYGHSFKHMKQN